MDDLIKTIELTYDPTARVLKETTPNTGEIGSTIDNESINFIVKMTDAKDINDQFDVWLDFAVKCEVDHRVIRPIGVLKYDKDNDYFAYSVKQYVLAAASRTRKLPLQLTMREKDKISPQIIVSRNTLEFKVTRAIDSLGMAVESVPYIMLRSNPWEWDEEIVYQKGAIAVYNSRIYQSEWDGNQGAIPRGEDGVISPAWSEVTGAPGSYYKPVLNDDDTTLGFELVDGEVEPPVIDPMNVQGQGLIAKTADDGARLEIYKVIKGVEQNEPYLSTIIRGESIEPEWDGTRLVIYGVRGTERYALLEPVDLKGDSLVASFDGTKLVVKQVDNAGNVIDTVSKDIKGDSLISSFNDTVLTITQVNVDGKVISTVSSNLKGDSVKGEFDGTILKITNYDKEGHTLSTESSNLKGDSLTAEFTNSILVVNQVDNEGTIVGTTSKNLKGDSLTAEFKDSTLTVKQVDNAGTVINATSKNLKGDSLTAKFDDTTLVVKQVDNAGEVVSTAEKNLKGDSLTASFDGTTLTINQKNNAGTTINTTSSNLKGDSVKGEFDGTVLKITNYDKDNKTLSTQSSNLKGDSLTATFDNTTLTLKQVDNAGNVVDTTSKNLKGDSLNPSFVGTTLIVKQVNNAGTTVDTVAKNLKGDSLSAEFDESTLTITQTDVDGKVVDTVSKNLKGDSIEPSFDGTTLIVKQVDNTGETVKTVSSDLKGTFNAEWVNDDASLRITDNSGVKAPVYVRGDDLSADLGEDKLTITRYHNGSLADTKEMWVGGDKIVPTWNGTILTIDRYLKGELVSSESMDLKGERGHPFRVEKTYPSVDEMNADFETSGLELGAIVAIVSTVEDPDNAKLYAKGAESWEFIVDMSGATGIQGPQGIQGFKGNSLSAAFTGTTLVVSEKDYAGALVNSTSSNLKGDSVRGEFEGTSLKIINYDKEGKILSTQSKDVKGDGLTAEFNETTLVVKQVDNAGTVVDTASKNLKGDSIEPSFDGTTLIVKQVDNTGETVKTVSSDLKGTFNAEWVNDDASLRITDNSGVKAPVYVRGDDLSADLGEDKLTITRYHNGSLADTKEMWVGGDKIVPTWNGTILTIDRYLKGELVSSESMDLKGERGHPFRVEKTYPSVDEMNADFETSGLELGAIVAIVSTVEDPDNAKLYAKGAESWEFIVDMSGATGIQGPQGIQGFKGNSLSAAFTGTTLVVSEKDYAGALVNSTSSNLKGDSVRGEFEGTSLKIINYDKEGKILSTQSKDVKGDGLTAEFNETTLVVKQVDNAGTVVDTASKNLKGDSLTAAFDSTTLTVKQVDNAGNVIDVASKDLKGDSLTPSFADTTLVVKQVDNTGKVISTVSKDLKGDSIVPSFSGTVLTVDQRDNTGKIITTVSSNLKGDSVKGEFDGTVLEITNYDKDNKTLSTSSSNLKGDSVEPSFDGTTLTLKQVDCEGETVTSVSSDLKGDSIVPTFSGTILKVDQVNTSGKVVSTVSKDLKGDSLQASFNDSTTLTVKQIDNAGKEIAKTSQNLKGDSLTASFDGSVLTITQKNNAGVAVDATSSDLLGPQGYIGNSLSAAFTGTTLKVTEKDHTGTVVNTTSSNLKGDSTKAYFEGTTLNVVNYDKDNATLSTDSANLKGDSLQASFTGTTLTVEQVDNAGNVVDTTSKDLKGEQGIQGIQGIQGEQGYSIYAAFNGYDLLVSSTNPDVSTVRKNVRGAQGIQGEKGYSVQGSLDGSILTITNYDSNMDVLSTMSEDVRGPQGVSMPAGGKTGQYLRKLDEENYNFYWADVQGTVTSVCGYYGDISLKASDVGALSDQTVYVSTVNGNSGSIQLKSINSQLLVGDGNIEVQPVLCSSGSAQNIRTINSISLLGTGDIQIPIIAVDGALDESSSNPVENKAIASLIPSEASSTNKLADKAFVNSSIATNTAMFLGTYDVVKDLSLDLTATDAQVATALSSKISVPTQNDYVFVFFNDYTDDLGVTDKYKRYKWNGTEWKFEYTLNNSSFTSAQWDAVNSGINATSVAKYDAYATNKQDKLKSGSNIKTVNGTSLVGSGNVSVQPVLYSSGENQNIKTINSTSLLGTGNISLQTPLTSGKDYVAHIGLASRIYGTDASSADTTYSLVSSFQSTPSGSNIPSEKLVKDSLDGKLDDAQLVTEWGASDSNVSDTKIPSAKLVKNNLDTKLDIVSTTGHTSVYGINSTGAQIMYDISSSASANTAAYRTTGGALFVGTPTADGHAATKKYVDTQINTRQTTLESGKSIKTINSASLLGSGNINLQTPLTAGTDYQVPLKSGTNIKTINETTLLGSGNIQLQTPLTAGTDYQTPLTAGTDYQTPLEAGTDYQTPLEAGVDYQAPLVSGKSIKTINSASLLGSGDIKLQVPLVSGTNIKTINSASLLGSGNIQLQTPLTAGTDYQTPLEAGVDYQAPLVSGKSIKTINSASLLGSGNIQLQTPLTAGTDYVAHSSSASILYGTNSSKVDTQYALTVQGTSSNSVFTSSNTDTQVPTSKAVYTAISKKQDKMTVDSALSSSSTNPVQNRVIASLVPSAATSSNQLADKNYVATQIAENTADFLGTFNVTALGLTTSATTAQVATKLNARTWSTTPKNNDYCFVYYDYEADTGNINKYERYKYSGTAWVYEYTLNNSTFTATQWNAINSGITGDDVITYNEYSSLISNAQSKANSAYDLADEIRKSDVYNSGATSENITQIGLNKEAIKGITESSVYNSGATSENITQIGLNKEAIKGITESSVYNSGATSENITQIGLNKEAIGKLDERVGAIEDADYIPQGGTLTKPLKVTGGHSGTAGKIILDEVNYGQITSTSTDTLLGFTSATSFVLNHPSYLLNIRGKGARPTYNGNDLALFSDIAAETSTDIEAAGETVLQTLSTENTNHPLVLSQSATSDTTSSLINSTKRCNAIYATPSAGSITATKFIGSLTGNCTGSSGSCTGNSATATALRTSTTTSISTTAGVQFYTGTILGQDGSWCIETFSGGTNIMQRATNIADPCNVLVRTSADSGAAWAGWNYSYAVWKV